MARAGAVEAPELALGLLAGLVGEGRLGDPLAVALGVVGAVLVAELLADGVELAPQHVLALRLLHALGDVVADAPAQLDLAERVARPGERALEPQLDVERLEQLELALQREVGRVAGGVRQRARLLDGAQERDDAARAARLEDLLDDDAVLACELVRVLADLVGVGVLGDVDAERAADALALARPSSARCSARIVAPRMPPGSMAGSPSSSATTPIGENRPLRRVAMTTRGGPSVANASSTAARASSLVIAIAIAMFGRITPSSRGRRGRIVVLMSVLMSEIQTRAGAVRIPP